MTMDATEKGTPRIPKSNHVSDDLEALRQPNVTVSDLQHSHAEWTQPNLDVNEIQSKLKTHEHFEVKSGYVMSGLPKFDDLTAYGIAEDVEFRFWNREVARLVKIANSPNALGLAGESD
jgi:hypothetical protein